MTTVAVIGSTGSIGTQTIEVVMAELKKNPTPKPARPAYPVRGKTQRGTVMTNGGGR